MYRNKQKGTGSFQTSHIICNISMYLSTYHISFLCVYVSIYHQSGIYAEILDVLLFIKTCLEEKLTIKIGVIHSKGILFLKQPKKNIFNMCCKLTKGKVIINTNHIFLFNLQFMFIIHSQIELVLKQTLEVNDICNNNFHSENKYPGLPTETSPVYVLSPSSQSSVRATSCCCLCSRYKITCRIYVNLKCQHFISVSYVVTPLQRSWIATKYTKFVHTARISRGANLEDKWHGS